MINNWWSIVPNRLTPLYFEIYYEVRTIYSCYGPSYASVPVTKTGPAGATGTG